MKNKLVVAFFVVASAFAIWSYLRMREQSGLGPGKFLEEAVGREFVSLLGDRTPRCVVILIDEIYKTGPDEPLRLKGIRSALAERNLTDESIFVEYIQRDPQDAQAGRVTFLFKRLLELAQAHPGCDTLLVCLDIPFPNATERKQLADSGVTIYTMPNNYESARKMVNDGIIGGALAPRQQIIATPGGYPDPASRVKNEYERLLR